MIRPDMATMLAFLTTDATVEAEPLARALRGAVEETFNRITVDGCTSTNDMVLCMAGGASGYRPDGEELGACLREACSELARAIVLDGEGATRFVAVRVRGAAAEEEAKKATWYRREIGTGQFAESIVLPAPVDAEHAQATVENGIVTLTFPKAEQARVKRITVQAGQPRSS